ncbi:MAG: DNA repair protein RecN [Cetobacterium sp.]|uniref:DNA repair protein RecN n=1 Tax=unclassified Cetobacterium TaxID=2630983 RepID=UPI00163B6A64|nr:DNA repair protein RecN [Cetobacterium sp. 2A]MBC2855998.1 DNA repair protein RecN [Cetobacterium sp. 2A]
MLKELKIENLAIIKSLDLEFDGGLVVLTGETGAGKSIILSGINLLIGEKSSSEMVRDGEVTLLAQGVFGINQEQENELKKLGIETTDNEVIVRRYLDKNGKGKAFVNNVRVPISSLKEIMGTLVDIVGQHSHQMLLNKNNHIKLLDKFLGESGNELKEKLATVYKKYFDINKKIKNIEKERKETLQKKEFYEFQLDELEKVNPILKEDEKLEEEYKKLFNAGKIKEKLISTESFLKDGEINALSIIYNSRKNLEVISKYGKEFQEISEKLDKIYYDLQECSDSISELNDDIDVDEKKLESVISRLDSINRLKVKYGSDISDILDYKNDISEKIKFLDENNFEIKKLIKEKIDLEQLYWSFADELTKFRKIKSLEIEKNLENELKLLNMNDVKFKIKFLPLETMGAEGSDNVEFLISTNIGQDLKSLSKIASGGEVSRIMLALKVIFSKVDNIPILIFDEIDTGVGGETVRKIATKLREIGNTTQVMSITHSPAIASKAHEQFYIEKNIVDGRTETTVKKLNSEERVQEIARMMAGKNISPAVLKHAKELLNEE